MRKTIMQNTLAKNSQLSTLKSGIGVTLASASLLMLAACSSAPKQNIELDNTQSRYEAIQGTPKFREVAPVEIEEAGKLLKKAHSMQAAGQDQKAVSHQLYLVSNQLDIVDAKVQRKQSISKVNEKQAVKNRLATTELEQQQKIEIVKANPTIGRQLRDQAQQLEFVESSRGEILTIDTTIFKAESTNLSPVGLRKAVELAAWLEANPSESILIEGYTSDLRDSETSMTLSQERAMSLKRALITQGADESRIGTFGYGQDFPYTHNESDIGRARNERIEVVASGAGNPIPKSRFESNRISSASTD